MTILAEHLRARGFTPSDSDELLFADAQGGPLSNSHGHADVRMTLDIYAEALETSERRASEALAARCLPPPPDSTAPNGPHRTLADEDSDQWNTVRRARWARDGDQDPQPVDSRPTG